MEPGVRAPLAADGAERKLILVIDDEEPNRRLLARVLTRAGFEVAVSPSAEEGLDFLSRRRPDLVLMDIRLQKMDGLEATRRIKSDPALASIPVVAVSAYAMTEDISRAREAGVSGYLTKPFRMKDIVSLAMSITSMKSPAHGR